MDKYLIEIENQKKLIKEICNLNEKKHNEFQKKIQLKTNMGYEIVDLKNKIKRIEKTMEEIKLISSRMKKLKIRHFLYIIITLLISLPLIIFFDYIFIFNNFIFSLLAKTIITITSTLIILNINDNYNYYKSDLDRLQNVNIENLKIKREQCEEKIIQLNSKKDEAEVEINDIGKQILYILFKIDLLKKKQLYFENLRNKAIKAILNDQQVLNMLEKKAQNDEESIKLIKNM